MGNIESVDGQSEMKHHIMPLKVPMPDPTELEEKFAIVLVSCLFFFFEPTLFIYLLILKQVGKSAMVSKVHRSNRTKQNHPLLF